LPLDGASGASYSDARDPVTESPMTLHRQNPSGMDTGDAEGSARFAFLAETSRCLAESLDLETTLVTAAGLALPHFGNWCMVDLVESDGTIRRVAVIHPDPKKQLLARNFYASNPPDRDDPLGAPRVIRTCESEFVLAGDEVLEGVAEEQRELLEKLGARSFLLVPMRARERTLGAITFVSDDRRRYDDADLLLAEDLGRRCAMAVDSARLYAASEEARLAATLTARRAEELLDEANLARYDAEVANRARTTFLGTISHEFRTPLTAVQGFTDLLLDPSSAELNSSQRHQIGRIRAASDQLLGLIDEILSYAQQQAGRSTLRVREVDLAALVREVALIVEPLAAESDLKLVLQIPDEPIPFVTDVGKLRQIILNLASNAVKFTDAGEIRLELQVDRDEVELRVSDTGIGIPRKDQEHVFTAFWQVDQSDARMGGTGLGLAVTRQLTDLLGGEVQFRSEDDGSLFTVRLPRQMAEAPANQKDDPPDSAVEHRSRGRRKKTRRGAVRGEASRPFDASKSNGAEGGD